MKIQIVALAARDEILEYKDFYTNPPAPSITTSSINVYIEKLLYTDKCAVINIKKWNE